MNTHNPQNATIEQIEGERFRFLTVEEFAILSDPKAFKTPVAANLKATLQPELWSQATCRWEPVNGRLDDSTTYRTQAPIQLQGSEAVKQFNPEAIEAASADFIEAFKYLSNFHHSIMREKGFWDAEESVEQYLRNSGHSEMADIVIAAFDGQKIALQTTEASEALEGIRHGNPPDDKIPEFLASEAEFADVMLRLMDHAHKRGWRVAEALIAKIAMNAKRPPMHGKKF